MGRVREIGMKMSTTAPGRVTYHYMQGRGYRAYINRDGVSVSSDFHSSYEEALEDLAVRLHGMLHDLF